MSAGCFSRPRGERRDGRSPGSPLLRFRPLSQGRMSRWTDWPSACGLQLRAQSRICNGVPFSAPVGHRRRGACPEPGACQPLRPVAIGKLSSGEPGAELCRSAIAIIRALAGRPHPGINPSCYGALRLIWVCTGVTGCTDKFALCFETGGKFRYLPGANLIMTDRRLRDLWDSLSKKKPHMPHFLEKAALINIRGIHDLDVGFEYPVSVLAGSNGSGKSTVLFAAACAYAPPGIGKEGLGSGIHSVHVFSRLPTGIGRTGGRKRRIHCRVSVFDTGR